MKKSIMKSLLLTAFSVATIGLRAQDKIIPDELINRSIETFANLMDSVQAQQFGLKSKSDLKSLKGGAQYKGYMIDLIDIQNYKRGDDVNKIITEYPAVEVALVTAGGRIVTSIEFIKKQGKWEASGYGSTPELIMLGRAQDSLPENVLTRGRLIRIPTLRLTFIAVGPPAQLEFISLQTRSNLKLAKNQKMPAGETILRLVPLATKHNGLPN